MSKILERIKRDKLKSAVIGTSIIIFIIGIVVTASNTNDTYAVTEACYFCPSSGKYSWSSAQPSTTCNSSWTTTSATKQADCGIKTCYFCTGTSSDGDNYFWGIEPTATCNGGSWQEKSVTEDNCKTPSTCYFCTGTSSNGNNYFWGITPTATCNGGSWQEKNVTESNCKAPVTYTITYDANGGSDAPSPQIKYKGVTLTLTSVKPVRDGYTFLGWDHRSTVTSPLYHSGDPYTSDAGGTLYAIWQANSTDDGDDNTDSGNSGDTGSNDSDKTESSETETTTPTTHKVKIKYNVSGGTIASSTTSPEGTKHSWTTTSEGIIKYDGNVFYNSVNYGKKINETGILDYNNPNYANIQRTGYTTEKGKEWICLSGCTTSGKTYDQSYLYNDSDFCNAKDGDCEVTLGVNWVAIKYKIEYQANGGTINGLPTEGTWNSNITINNPTKKVKLHVNENKTSATIGKDVEVEQEFTGWTSTTINENTAYHGDAAWTDGNVKVKDTTFKNLTSNNNSIVKMIANWEPKTVTLPTISKEGYTCNWNTKDDGKGTKYNSGAKYTIGSESSNTINLYGVCIADSKTDEELPSSPKTGDILIVVAWTIGIGALGYTVYYFRSRKSNI